VSNLNTREISESTGKAIAILRVLEKDGNAEAKEIIEVLQRMKSNADRIERIRLNLDV
jgi:hypothetical protein